MMAPVTPHVAEELWAQLGHAQSLAFEPFPVADPALLVDDVVEYPVQVNGKVRGPRHGRRGRTAGRRGGRGAGRRQGGRRGRRPGAEEGDRRPRPPGQHRRLSPHRGGLGSRQQASGKGRTMVLRHRSRRPRRAPRRSWPRRARSRSRPAAAPARARRRRARPSPQAGVPPVLTSTGQPVPKPLDELEAQSEDLIDIVPGGKWDQVAGDVASIDTAWAAYQPQGATDGAPAAILTGMETAVGALDTASRSSGSDGHDAGRQRPLGRRGRALRAVRPRPPRRHRPPGRHRAPDRARRRGEGPGEGPAADRRRDGPGGRPGAGPRRPRRQEGDRPDPRAAQRP